jgi:flagellar biogenesis protein FliO
MLQPGSATNPQGATAAKPSALDLLRSVLGRMTSISRSRVWRKRRRLRVCETLSLGNRGYLAVVSYRRQEFLVGGTANSISLLAQLPGDNNATEREDREGGEPAR